MVIRGFLLISKYWSKIYERISAALLSLQFHTKPLRHDCLMMANLCNNTQKTGSHNHHRGLAPILYSLMCWGGRNHSVYTTLSEKVVGWVGVQRRDGNRVCMS